MKKIVLVVLFCCFYGIVFAQEKVVITLEEYLSLVESKNPEIKSIDLMIDAMGKKILELDMVYSPFLSGSYSAIDDRSGPGFGSTLPTEKMNVNSWNVDLNKKFRTGTSVSLGYVNSNAAFDLLSPTQIIGDEKLSSFTGYEVKPSLRIEQSLLRDFNSGLTQSGIKKAKALTKAGQYMQTFARQRILLKARAGYWALSLAREVISSRKISLERAEKLLKWNEKRVNLDLADKGDLYQSQAAYKLRQLNLQQALEDEKKACREFNELMGLSSNVREEELEKISDEVSFYSKSEALSFTGQRADVLSAKSSFESSRYADKETFYRALPEISIFGAASLHGIGLNYQDAWNQVADARKPNYAVGLSFIVPLDLGTLRKVKEGYRLEFSSAKEALTKSELSAKNDWEQLMFSWESVMQRLKIASDLRDIQNNRVKNEITMFERGRSTTFQLLNAENDLDDSILNVYRLTFEAITTYSQAELYNSK